jgi:hypothetical protein
VLAGQQRHPGERGDVQGAHHRKVLERCHRGEALSQGVAVFKVGARVSLEYSFSGGWCLECGE